MQGTFLYNARYFPIQCKVLSFTMQGTFLYNARHFPLQCKVLSFTMQGTFLYNARYFPLQCKVLSATSGHTKEIPLALKGCTNGATLNIHYRRPANFFHVTGYEVIILKTANCRNTCFVTSNFKNSPNWRRTSVLKKNFQEKTCK